VLRAMRDMPIGTIGFEAIGEVDDDDWERTVEPALRRRIADGHRIRLLYLLGPDAHDVEGDAVKAGAGFRARHATVFDRVAIVTDEEWMHPAVRVVSAMLPGKAKGFPLHELSAAKAWLAEGAES
jgi:hypothetical protein